VPFGVATDGLVFIKNHEDRNALYSQVFKPLKPTRPELTDIKKWLDALGNGNGFKSTLARKDVKKAIDKARESKHKSQEFIKLLKLLANDPLTKQKQGFEEAVEVLRKTIFGQDATKDEFNVIPLPRMEKKALTVHFKVTEDNFEAVVKNVENLLRSKGFRQLLGSFPSCHLSHAIKEPVHRDQSKESVSL